MIPETWRNQIFRPAFAAYLIDWLVIAVFSVCSYFISKSEPRYREFSLTDAGLRYTHAPQDIIPFWLLTIICFLVPAVLITIAALVMGGTQDLNHGLLGLGLAISLCTVITEALKVNYQNDKELVFVGRPRPDFLARCQPPLGAVDPPFGLSNYTICTASLTTNTMTDGFKSFPSGHAAYSFCGYTYLSFYIAGLIHLFNQRRGQRAVKSILFLTPLGGALFITISRLNEHRHHWSDLLFGGILGVACGVFAYRQYHPSLFEETNAFQSSRRISRSENCRPDGPERPGSGGPSIV